VLAFAIASDGKLRAMTVGPDGGHVTFPEVVSLTFPSPIRLTPVASGSETIGGNREQRRHRGDA
jgi:hypothetical protein